MVANGEGRWALLSRRLLVRRVQRTYVEDQQSLRHSSLSLSAPAVQRMNICPTQSFGQVRLHSTLQTPVANENRRSR